MELRSTGPSGRQVGPGLGDTYQRHECHPYAQHGPTLQVPHYPTITREQGEAHSATAPALRDGSAAIRAQCRVRNFRLGSVRKPPAAPSGESGVETFKFQLVNYRT